MNIENKANRHVPRCTFLQERSSICLRLARARSFAQPHLHHNCVPSPPPFSPSPQTRAFWVSPYFIPPSRLASASIRVNSRRSTLKQQHQIHYRRAAQDSRHAHTINNQATPPPLQTPTRPPAYVVRGRVHFFCRYRPRARETRKPCYIQPRLLQIDTCFPQIQRRARAQEARTPDPRSPDFFLQNIHQRGRKTEQRIIFPTLCRIVSGASSMVSHSVCQNCLPSFVPSSARPRNPHASFSRRTFPNDSPLLYSSL